MIATVKHLPLTLAASLTAIGSFASAPAAAQTGGGGPPPLPQNGAAAQSPAAQASPAVATAPAATSTASTRQQVNERVRRGLVVLKKNGTPTALGTVIGDDGRILTALSGLGGASTGGAEAAEVVYADGTVVLARVGNVDRQSDLALLVPLAPPSDRWTESLSASGLDPVSLPLHAIVPTHGARLAPTEAEVKGLAEVHAHDGQALPHMLDLDVKGPVFAGAPMLDARGDLVAVLVKACKGAAPAGAAPGDDAWAAWEQTPQPTAGPATCTPVVVGAPVTSIRSFLMSAALGAAPAVTPGVAPVATPAVAAAPAPWLGIRVEPQTSGSVRGVQVVAVAPKSPAQSAALKPAADIIAAVDGDWVDSPEALAGVIRLHDVGDTVKLLIFNQGKFRDVSVVLRAAP